MFCHHLLPLPLARPGPPPDERSLDPSARSLQAPSLPPTYPLPSPVVVVVPDGAVCKCWSTEKNVERGLREGGFPS